MHNRYRSSLVALALLTLSATTPPASAAAQDATPTDTAQQAADAARLATCATPTVGGSPIAISGKGGVTQSLPFTLDQPAYSVIWTLAAPSDRATYITLESVTDTSALASRTLVNASGNDPTSGGQTAVYKVKPGQYYLAVRAPAGWSVTFTPLAV